MRITAYILCIITLLLCFSGCKSVIVSESDEIIYNKWYKTGSNGISAELKFDIASNIADFRITEAGQSDICISGKFTIDNSCIYIFDSSVFNTYTFTYKVFADRLVLGYGEGEIELIKKDCADESNSPD